MRRRHAVLALSVFLVCISLSLYLGRPLEDEYQVLRRYNPEESWMRHPSFEAVTGHRLHVFKFKQPLVEFCGALGMTVDQAKVYAAQYSNPNAFWEDSREVTEPKLPSGKPLTLIPSKSRGFSWELRIADDEPSPALAFVHRIKKRLGLR